MLQIGNHGEMQRSKTTEQFLVYLCIAIIWSLVHIYRGTMAAVKLNVIGVCRVL